MVDDKPNFDKAMEPGSVMSLAFQTELEGHRLAMVTFNGGAAISDIYDAIEEYPNDAEPRLALGWLRRWYGEKDVDDA